VTFLKAEPSIRHG